MKIPDHGGMTNKIHKERVPKIYNDETAIRGAQGRGDAILNPPLLGSSNSIQLHSAQSRFMLTYFTYSATERYVPGTQRRATNDRPGTD